MSPFQNTELSASRSYLGQESLASFIIAEMAKGKNRSANAHPKNVNVHQQPNPNRQEQKPPKGDETLRLERAERQLEEYKILRAEIEAIWTQTYGTLNFLLAFIGLSLTAAFIKEVSTSERILLLIGSSVVTAGGYRLIRLHTARVWRITTYMRSALEPELPGIGWETRLFLRDQALRDKHSKNPVDTSLFDGHIQILHGINVLLSTLMLWTLLPASTTHELLSRVDRFWFMRYLPALLPIGIILYNVIKKLPLRRSGTLEKQQLDAWNHAIKGGTILIYKFEPGADTVPKE